MDTNKDTKERNNIDITNKKQGKNTNETKHRNHNCSMKYKINKTHTNY